MTAKVFIIIIQLISVFSAGYPGNSIKYLTPLLSVWLDLTGLSCRRSIESLVLEKSSNKTIYIYSLTF